MRRISAPAVLFAGVLLAGCGRPAAAPAEPHAALAQLPERVAGLEVASASEPKDSSITPATSPIQHAATYRMARGGAAALPIGASPASVTSHDLHVSIATHTNGELVGLAVRIMQRRAAAYSRHETPHGLIYESPRECAFSFDNHVIFVTATTDAACEAGLPATAARALQTALAGDPGTGGPEFFGRPLW